MKIKVTHTVPMSGQVVTLFTELKEWTGHGELVFPSPFSATRCISDMGLLNTLRRLGYGKDEMTIHGFRGMASTLLNECGKYRRDVIEAQLAHGKRNKVRGAYNHADLTQRWNESGWAVLHCRPQTILDESGKEIAKVKTPYTPNGYKDVPINSDLPGADGGGLMP